MSMVALPCRILSALAIFLMAAGQSAADEPRGRTFIGALWLLSNDYLGDMNDRWRSSSLQAGFVFARPDSNLGNYSFGEIIEVRAGAEYLSPEELDNGSPDARPLATAVSFGLHAHVREGPTDMTLGLDIYTLGSQTGIGRFVADTHPSLSDEVRDKQVTERFVPTVTGEIARNLAVAPGVALRPFAEARAGVETYARVGVDLILGLEPETTMPARDTTTGQILWLTGQPARGWALVAGGDVAHVVDSLYLPENRVSVENPRVRLRAGGLWRGDVIGAFYGVTWLGEEFEGQSEPQVLGSIRFEISF